MFPQVEQLLKDPATNATHSVNLVEVNVYIVLLQDALVSKGLPAFLALLISYLEVDTLYVIFESVLCLVSREVFTTVFTGALHMSSLYVICDCTGKGEDLATHPTLFVYIAVTFVII